MALIFKCPACGVEIIIQFLKVGEVAKCKNCGAQVVVPEDAQKTERKSTLLNRYSEKISTKVTEKLREEEIKQGKYYPGFSQGLWLIILYILLIAVLTIPIFIAGKVINYPISKEPLIKFIVSLSAFLIILRYGYKKTHRKFKEIFPINPVRFPLFIPMIITLLGIIILRNQIDSFIVSIIPGSERLSNYYYDLTKVNLRGSIVLMIIIGPIIEEAFFRGLILRGFLNRYSVIKAIMLSSLLFGIFHLNPWQLCSSFILGILLAWWTIQTHSLLPSIFGHALNNGLFVIGFTIMRPDLKIYQQNKPWEIFLAISIGLILSVWGIWLSKRMFTKITLQVNTESVSGE